MSVGVMKDYKLKRRNLHDSHTLITTIYVQKLYSFSPLFLEFPVYYGVVFVMA